MDEAETLRILHQDDHYIAVYKPSGLIVHHNRYQPQGPAALQLARATVGEMVYPVHRLDRATSGVLVFAMSSEAAGALAAVFRNHEVQKTYWAVVRGHTLPEGKIDYPLTQENSEERVAAVTEYHALEQVELPYPCGRYATSRYSLVEVRPMTGKHHQIRRHFKHISHPVIGDTWHGDGEHNRLFREKFGIHRLLLQAVELSFRHPFSNRETTIRCDTDEEFIQIFPNAVKAKKQIS